MHVGVYGSGHLATVISACLADFGVPVTCVEENGEKLTAMAQGAVGFFEKNLADMVRRNVRAGRLIYSRDLAVLARQKPVIFLAADTTHLLEETAERLGRQCCEETVLVICTPISVGTASRIEERLHRLGAHLRVVVQPLSLTEGCAVEDFNWPDRILLGTTHASAVQTLKKLYHPLVMRGVPIIVTSTNTAELVREATSAFLATKISFINEMSALCEHVQADSGDLALALGLDKKIAPRCLQPGAIFGGPFAEADLDSLSRLAYGKGVDLKVLKAARDVNTLICDRIMDKISAAMHSGLTGKQVALLGLSFKPNTSSVASSSSITLAKRLLKQGAQVKAYDPVAMAEAKVELNGTVRYCETAYLAAEGSDALVLSTGWPEFRNLDFGAIKKAVKTPVIVDTKNMLDASRMRNMGFEYVGMGRA